MNEQRALLLKRGGGGEIGGGGGFRWSASWTQTVHLCYVSRDD